MGVMPRTDGEYVAPFCLLQVWLEWPDAIGASVSKLAPKTVDIPLCLAHSRKHAPNL